MSIAFQQLLFFVSHSAGLAERESSQHLVLRRLTDAVQLGEWGYLSYSDAVVVGYHHQDSISLGYNTGPLSGSSEKWPPDVELLKYIQSLYENPIKDIYDSFRNEDRWNTELHRLLREIYRRESYLYPLGTFHADHLPASFHVRRDVLKFEGQRRKRGLATYNTEALFDHERLHEFIDPYCNLRGGIIDGAPGNSLSLWRSSFPTGISPLWVCNRMRYLSRADIVRRHSGSNILHALATNRKPRHQFPRPILAETFPVHKFIPLDWDTTGIATTDPTPSFSHASSPKTTFSQMEQEPQPDIHYLHTSPVHFDHEEIEAPVTDRKADGDSTFIGHLTARMDGKESTDSRSLDEVPPIRRHEYSAFQISAGTKCQESSDTSGKVGTSQEVRPVQARVPRRGRVAGFKGTRWVEDVVVKEVRRLTGGRLEGLNPRQCQLRSHWLLDISKKSMRLVRHQLNEEYLDALRFLYRSSTVLGGLQPLRHVLWQLGGPDRRYTTIVVTGSFGKTIVASKICGALVAVGFQVGLFMSPHLTSFRERISVNGRLISKSEVVHITNCVKKALETCTVSPTFFETATLIALCHFCNQRCDYVVLESGSMGGSDPINCINRIACTAITGITVENGDNDTAVVRKYLNLIRPHSILVLGPTAAAIDILKDRATALETLLVEVGFEPNETIDSEDARIAEAVVTNLNIPIATYRFVPGLNVRPPLRFHRLSYRDRNIAARHVHYFLKCAYNMTRAMHMQWRAIAISHPDLCATIERFWSSNAHISSRKVHAWEDAKQVVEQYTPQYTEAPSVSHSKRQSFRAPLELNRFVDETRSLSSNRTSGWSSPVIISRGPTGTIIRQRRLRSWNETSDILPISDSMSTETAEQHDFSPPYRKRGTENLLNVETIEYSKEVIDTVKRMEAIRSTEKQVMIAHRERAIQTTQLWRPSNSESLSEGVHLFLTFCSAATEEWPENYIAKLPFRNWISEYRKWNEKQKKNQIQRIDKEQQWRLNLLHHINQRACSMSRLLSFLHFVAFRNESLYWNLTELLQLRESGSPYLRPPEWIKHQFTNMPEHLVEFGHTPSIARIVGTALKARIKRDELCKFLLPSHSTWPTPPAIVIDITPNEYAFERLFLQFKKYYPSRSVRICVALDNDQPVHILNSVVWALNHYGKDSSKPRTEIKGIHILEPEHFRSKRISSFLFELATDPVVDASLKSIMVTSLLTQLHWHLCLFPPISPIPTELLNLLRTLSVRKPGRVDDPAIKKEIEKLKQQINTAIKLKWSGRSDKAKQNLEEIIKSDHRFKNISNILSEISSVGNEHQTTSFRARSARIRKPIKRQLSSALNYSKLRCRTELAKYYKKREEFPQITASQLQAFNECLKFICRPWRHFDQECPSKWNLDPINRCSRQHRRCRLISFLSLPILLHMHKEQLRKVRRSQPLTNRRNYNHSHLFNRRTVKCSTSLEDYGTDSSVSSRDSISSSTLRNIILLQRLQSFRSDLYDSVSCVSGQIEVQYDWWFRPSPLLGLKTVHPFLGPINRWKFILHTNQSPTRFDSKLLPPFPQNLKHTIRLLDAFNVPENIRQRFLKLQPLYSKLEARDRWVGSSRHATFDFPTPHGKRDTTPGIGTVQPVERIFANSVPIILLHFSRNPAQQKNWNPSRTVTHHVTEAEKAFRKTTSYQKYLPRIEVIGYVEITDKSKIQAIPIWIGNKQLKLATLKATYTNVSGIDERKHEQPKSFYQRFVLFPKNLTNTIGAFSSTGLWFSFEAHAGKRKSEDFVAVRQATFRQLLSDGFWNRLVLIVRSLPRALRCRPSQVLKYTKKRVLTEPRESPSGWNSDLRVMPGKNGETEKQVTPVFMKSSLEDIDILLRSGPKYVKRMAQSLRVFLSEGRDFRRSSDCGLSHAGQQNGHSEQSVVGLFEALSARRVVKEFRHHECSDLSDGDGWSDDYLEETKKSNPVVVEGSVRTARPWGELHNSCKNVREQMRQELRELLEHMRQADSMSESKEEAEFYKTNGVDFNRFSHLLRLEEGAVPRLIVDILQPGDLQTQLSIIFQKAAAEQSALLICGTPLMAREVMLTLGCCLSPSSSEDPVIVTSPCVTEEIIQGSFPLDPEAFPHGYVTISPSSMARRSANAYLKDARYTRHENERTKQSEIIRYHRENQYRV